MGYKKTPASRRNTQKLKWPLIVSFFTNTIKGHSWFLVSNIFCNPLFLLTVRCLINPQGTLFVHRTSYAYEFREFFLRKSCTLMVHWFFLFLFVVIIIAHHCRKCNWQTGGKLQKVFMQIAEMIFYKIFRLQDIGFCGIIKLLRVYRFWQIRYFCFVWTLFHPWSRSRICSANAATAIPEVHSLDYGIISAERNLRALYQ